MRSLKYLNKYLLKYKFKLMLGICFVIFSNIFSLLPAKFIGDAFRIIENITVGSEINQFSDGSAIAVIEPAPPRSTTAGAPGSHRRRRSPPPRQR